ncbi:MAG: DUF1425 domain-containing protein [Planctomycetes bacterium]|nr:DUF1425 domain-containing protein [Planctomycetota bacterium]
MKKTALFCVMALAGCSSDFYYEDSDADVPEPREGPIDVSGQIDRVALSSELSTSRTRDMAKTIEWPDMSTSEGNEYLGGAVTVDKIFRYDADNLFVVKVRLQNETDQSITFEWKVTFLDRHGRDIAGFGFEDADAWKSLQIEPLSWETVSSNARIRGAVGFKLWIRPRSAPQEEPTGRP